MNLSGTSDQIESQSNQFPSLTPAHPISRNGVVQAVLDLFDKPDYLEIGVNRGKTFNSVIASTKVAVDPKFLFDFQQVAAQTPGTQFWETTSDDYFGTIAGARSAFDVIYLDGLHTSEQTIRDLINSLSFLKPKGVIIIDDVFPSSYAASMVERNDSRIIRREIGESAGAWMGDVYRLIFFVETFCQQFSYGTVNNNHGQLLLWRDRRASVPDRTLMEVAGKSYKDLFLEKESFRFAPLGDIITRIREAHSRTQSVK